MPSPQRRCEHDVAYADAPSYQVLWIEVRISIQEQQQLCCNLLLSQNSLRRDVDSLSACDVENRSVVVLQLTTGVDRSIREKSHRIFSLLLVFQSAADLLHVGFL